MSTRRDGILLERFDAAERDARTGDALPAVAQAYVDAIAGGGPGDEPPIDATLAEILGRRMLALEDECVLPRSVIIAGLEGVLRAAPAARWALEQLALLCDGAADGDRLLVLYERAIAAAESDRTRADLLADATVVARDLAGDPGRAIGYLGAIQRLAPPPITGTKPGTEDCLDERIERVRVLVDLLVDRTTARSGGGVRPSLERSAIAIQLAAGQVEEAATALESMLGRGTPVAYVADLVERLARHPDRSPAFVDGIRRLLRLHHRVAVVVATALEDSEGEGGARVARAAYRSLLAHALAGWRSAHTDADFDAAAELAWGAIERLSTVYSRSGDFAHAARLLERGARLRFDRSRQRDLLSRAALLLVDRVGDAPRARRLMNEVFQENDADPIAAGLFSRFAALLEAAGEEGRLAMLWEGVGRRAARARHLEEERASFARAGFHWERAGAPAKALAVLVRSAALGSRLAHEGLARLHVAGGRWAEAAVSLAWLRARSDGVERIGYTLRLAETGLELGESEHRFRCLEEEWIGAAAGIPTALRARRRDLYRRAGMHSRLAAILEVDALHAGGPPEAAALLIEAAELQTTKLEDPTEEIRLLRLAVERDPGGIPTRLRLAQAFAREERWTDALAILSPNVAKLGDRSRSHQIALRRGRSEALLRLGRNHDALIELQAAARLAPTDPEIRLAVGRLARQCDDLRTAERAFRAALLAARPADETVSRVAVLVDLAALAAERGDAVASENLLESAFEAGGPSHETTAPAQGATVEDHLERARAHLAVDELIEAFEHLKAGFSVDRRDPELAFLLGLVAIDLDEKATAERALLAVVACGPHDGCQDRARDRAAFTHLALLAEARTSGAERGPAHRRAG